MKKEVFEEKDFEKETSWKKEVLSMGIYILAVFCLTFVFVHFVAQRTQVSGSSMNPTLEHGDNLIVNKLSYRFSDPERFDIIVFPFKHEENTYYIKRVIGLPGETVQIEQGKIYIDGEILEESYGKEVMNWSGSAEDPIELGEDEYFVLGDNRNNSSDSRDPSVGLIKREDIVGKAGIRIWPLSKFGVLKHQ
ncbi:MAG: signal peptidase I [Lachnospiraceae bacterium]